MKWLAGALTLALMVALPEGHAQDRALVTDVVLRGVRSVDADLLREGLVTQPTRCRQLLYTPLCAVSQAPVLADRRYLDPLELRRDVLRIRLFYWRHGWRDAEVASRTERDGDGVRVIFDVTEHEPTRITVLSLQERDSVLGTERLQALVPLRAGAPLDLFVLDTAVLRIRDALWSAGHPDATVTIDTAQVSNVRNEGPVTVTVVPGPAVTVRDIVVQGTSIIDEATVRRLLRFRPGDPYRRDDVLESQRDLYVSGFFDRVELFTRNPQDTARTVVVRVSEGPLRRLELRGGATTADFLQLQGELTRRHFLGGVRRLTTRLTVSNLLAPQLNGRTVFQDVTGGAPQGERDTFLRPTWSASVELLQPSFLGPRNQLGVSVFTHRRSQPGVVTDRGSGVALALSRDVTPRTSATLGYTLDVSRIEASDVYFCVSVGLCVTPAIRAVSRRNPLASIAAVGQLDTSDDPFAPRRGWRVRGELEHASAILGSDFAYHRVHAWAAHYVRVGRTAVLASRLRTGWIDPLAQTNRRLRVPDAGTEPIVHPRKAFFAGGSRSVRGYGENQLGPRVLTIDPQRLLDSTLATPCTATTLATGSCDPNSAGLEASAFQPRPLGGNAVAEGNVELRFPLVRSFGLGGTLFLDGAVVGTARFTELLGATATITPGFGVRLDTPVGPVRLDLGVRPRVEERLPVITQVPDSANRPRLVTLRTLRRYDAAEAAGGFLSQVLSRLTLHLAIGPAF